MVARPRWPWRPCRPHPAGDAPYWPGPAILIPYLLLFFCAILLMGLPMFFLNRLLWLVTVLTATSLFSAMGAALRAGVG